MKKLLFLVIISCRLFAGTGELEDAIIASDLSAFEQALGKETAITSTEKIALIELAAAVIQKREDLRTVCDMRGWANCQEIRNELADLIKARYSYANKSFYSGILFGTIFWGLAMYGQCTKDVYPSNAELIAVGLTLAIIATSFISCVYNCYKMNKQDNELCLACIERCETLWNNAIKIRQLLYKLTTIDTPQQTQSC